MNEDEVTATEARQASRLAAVKAKVEGHVNAEIGGDAVVATAGGRARVHEVAAQLRDSAIDETVNRERSVGNARTAARGSQFLDYAFFVLYTLLAVRLILALIAARSGNGFVRFIATVTEPFFAPFRGIVASPTAEGGHTLVVPLLIAIVAYAVLHMGINGLLRMVGSRKTII